MEELNKWLESKKEEWKEGIEKAKEVGKVDENTLDIMSTLIDGIKVRKYLIKKGRRK